LDETDLLLHDLGTPGDQARRLHTLKGNAAIFGFQWFAAQCHTLEDELAIGEEVLPARLHGLGASWHRSLELLRPFVGHRTHDVRNAVDHGLEPVADRVASGKPEAGQLVLACAQTETGFVFSVTDDGRGVNWERVVDRARSLGLPTGSRADLIEALFGDGVST